MEKLMQELAAEAEKTNPIEMQREGWQAIPDNFKKYAESHTRSSSFPEAHSA